MNIVPVGAGLGVGDCGVGVVLEPVAVNLYFATTEHSTISQEAAYVGVDVSRHPSCVS